MNPPVPKRRKLLKQTFLKTYEHDIAENEKSPARVRIVLTNNRSYVISKKLLRFLKQENPVIYKGEPFGNVLRSTSDRESVVRYRDNTQDMWTMILANHELELISFLVREIDMLDYDIKGYELIGSLLEDLISSSTIYAQEKKTFMNWSDELYLFIRKKGCEADDVWDKLEQPKEIDSNEKIPLSKILTLIKTMSNESKQKVVMNRLKLRENKWGRLIEKYGLLSEINQIIFSNE